MKYLSCFAVFIFAAQVFCATKAHPDGFVLNRMGNVSQHVLARDFKNSMHERRVNLHDRAKSPAKTHAASASATIKAALDSVVIPNVKKSMYLYSAGGLCLHCINCNWDSGASAWINRDKSEYTYDSGSSNMLTKIVCNWDSGSSNWINYYKDEYTYDADRNILTYVYSNWAGSGAWINSFKNEYAYDAKNNILANNSYVWDSGVNNWIFYSRDEYTYDSNSNELADSSFDWDSGLNAWIPYSKYECTYDSNSNELTEINSNWSSELSTWVPYFKSAYAYDSNSNELADIYYNWNPDSGNWSACNKDEYTYDACNKVSTDISYSWDYGLNDWTYSGKHEYTYDANNNMLTRISYNRDASYYGTWIPSSKDEYSFDLAVDAEDIIAPAGWNSYRNKILTYSNYGWDTSALSWNSLLVQNYYYSSLSVPIKTSPIVSSVPFSVSKTANAIRLNFNSNSPARVKLSTVSGRRLVCKTVKSGENIDISDFAPGLYVLGISGEGMASRTCRILKE